ncbi:unnamed protein product [Calicophoron daubneyi]|uniref:Leucine-rich repeat-containing protein 23 n=1 Tax=Calicophoron daubneyi TaxID=300641 RepID=A0AAV2T2D0_CALDB
MAAESSSTLHAEGEMSEETGSANRDVIKSESPDSPKAVAVHLTDEIILASLSSIEPTIDGLMYAPTTFVCNKLQLTDLERLQTFIYLRHINVAQNALTDMRPLIHLHNLIDLNASHNKISQIAVGQWPCMTHLNLNFNQISEIPELRLPRLKVLCLNNNKIRSLVNPKSGAPILTASGLPQLHTLQLSHNQLHLMGRRSDDPNLPRTLNIQLPNLKALFLSYNALTSLAVYRPVEPEPSEVKAENSGEHAVEHSEGNLDDEQEKGEQKKRGGFILSKDESALGMLPQLSVLSVRNNGLHDLDGINLMSTPKLQYLNLRENVIDTMDEIDKLVRLPRLRTVILIDNPLCELKDYRLEMRVTLLSLRRLDKEMYTPEENEEADILAEQRRLDRLTADAY